MQDVRMPGERITLQPDDTHGTSEAGTQEVLACCLLCGRLGAASCLVSGLCEPSAKRKAHTTQKPNKKLHPKQAAGQDFLRKQMQELSNSQAVLSAKTAQAANSRAIYKQRCAMYQSQMNRQGAITVALLLDLRETSGLAWPRVKCWSIHFVHSLQRLCPALLNSVKQGTDAEESEEDEQGR